MEPEHLVETFLSAGTDALIRRAVGDDPFFQRVHERAAAANAGLEVRWLSALLGSARQLRVDEEDADGAAAFCAAGTGVAGATGRFAGGCDAAFVRAARA